MRHLSTLIAFTLLLLVGTAQAQSDGGLLGDDGGGLGGGSGDSDFLEPAEEPGSGGGQQGQAAQQNANVERFQDWGVRCGMGDGGPRGGCEMFQGVTRNDNNELVMRVAIGYPPRQDIDAPVAVFQLPLGIHLPPGIQLSVDDGEPVRFPVQACFQPGCRADLPLKPELLSKLKSGSEATLSVLGPGGEQIDLPISLMGFTAALERISQ
ncbi:invasion associated locus B family protein [Arhodomonas sp. AD133]|uniref:invasion associated locus B family protein n=1 Tax=Arhodomonas sp. AD133 TaxID=3415009 RepID=UPI003EB8ECAF